MCPCWFQHGPWYNFNIYERLCCVTFEVFYLTEIQDRYELICALDSHDKQEDRCCGSTNSLGGRYFPNTYSKMAPKLIGDKINFIESWLKML